MDVSYWPHGLLLIGDLAILLAVVYSLAALLAVIGWQRRGAAATRTQPAITILKPLCGLEEGLYKNLRSFCTQSYPEFQVIFGVNDTDDPALDIAQGLREEFHELNIVVMADGSVAGANRKVTNLAHMLKAARHEYLVIADSDMQVGPDYLSRIVAPLIDTDVGLVTCLYRAHPVNNLWSRIGGLFIDDWFAPSVLVAALLRGDAYAFGATIAMRRATLEAIGGFKAVANYLADDYMLGALTRQMGLRTVLSDYVVTTTVGERQPKTLLAHEIRWMRTLRALQPVAYRLIFITFTLPLAILGCALAMGHTSALALTAVAFASRASLHCVQARSAGRNPWPGLWLLPARDLLLVYVWFRGLSTRTIEWRARQYIVERCGFLRKVH